MILNNFGLSTIGDGPIYNRPIVGKRNFEIFYILPEYAQPKIILEIGSWEGSSALSWGEGSEKYDSEIICVDTWLGSVEHYENILPNTEWSRDHIFLEDGYPSIYKTFVTNIRRNNLQNRIISVPIDSRQAFLIFEKANLVPDICYIDAAHDYHSVLADLNGAKKIGSKIICGDDYYYHNSPEIKEAVDYFAEENGLRVVTKQNQFVLINDSQQELYELLKRFNWDDC